MVSDLKADLIMTISQQRPNVQLESNSAACRVSGDRVVISWFSYLLLSIFCSFGLSMLSDLRGVSFHSQFCF